MIINNTSTFKDLSEYIATVPCDELGYHYLPKPEEDDVRFVLHVYSNRKQVTICLYNKNLQDCQIVPLGAVIFDDDIARLVTIRNQMAEYDDMVSIPINTLLIPDDSMTNLLPNHINWPRLFRINVGHMKHVLTNLIGIESESSDR